MTAKKLGKDPRPGQKLANNPGLVRIWLDEAELPTDWHAEHDVDTYYDCEREFQRPHR